MGDGTGSAIIMGVVFLKFEWSGSIIYESWSGLKMEVVLINLRIVIV